MTDPLRDVLNSIHGDTVRYAQMAATIRDLNPKKMTTAEVQAVFNAIAMFFDRAGEEHQNSAESIERILMPLARLTAKSAPFEGDLRQGQK